MGKLKLNLSAFAFFSIGLILNAQNNSQQEQLFNNLIQTYDSDSYFSQTNLSEVDWHDRYTDEERLLLKDILFHFGYEIDTDTSQWTQENSEVVKVFQQDNFIKVDGKIGPETLSTMSFILHELYRHHDEESFQESSQSSIGKILFTNYDRVRVGDMVKYWHYDFDKWLYARVTKIVDTTVFLHDWRRDERFIMDMDDIEGY